MNFKKWVKSIQTASYSCACTVFSLWLLCITFVWPRGSRKLPTTAPPTNRNTISWYFTLIRFVVYHLNSTLETAIWVQLESFVMAEIHQINLLELCCMKHPTGLSRRYFCQVPSIFLIECKKIANYSRRSNKKQIFTT